METHPLLTYDRPFRLLFEDSVALLLASEHSPDNDESNSLARGSIACTMLLPEVAANICIESLRLESWIFGEIDRLSPLAKFDYYLKCRYRGRQIPSGVHQVQKLQDLKRLRDAFVHPKRFPVHWKPSPENDGSYIGESKKTQFLGISSNPTMWFDGDAVGAMKAAHEFFGFFFAELCKMRKGAVTDLLFSDEVPLVDKGAGIYYCRRSFYLALKRWKVHTSYLRMGAL